MEQNKQRNYNLLDQKINNIVKYTKYQVLKILEIKTQELKLAHTTKQNMPIPKKNWLL